MQNVDAYNSQVSVWHQLSGLVIHIVGTNRLMQARLVGVDADPEAGTEVRCNGLLSILFSDVCSAPTVITSLPSD